MGYFTYLKELLSPTLCYELGDGLGASELVVEGAGLDEVFAQLLQIEREAFLVTADSYGITLYEDIVPSRPVSESREDRRAALLALLLIDGCGFTSEALNVTLRGCGIDVIAEEGTSPMTVNVFFPYVRGMPRDFDELKKRIEQILPCHLDIAYVFSYAHWPDIESIGTWAALEARLHSWFELEAYTAG